MKNWQAAQFNGTTWGLLALDTRNWHMFGTEKRMKHRANELNQQDMMARELRHLEANLEELQT